MTSKELAKETGIAERYAREWLSHQAASGHLDYDPVCGAFTLTPEQAMVFANSNNWSICKARSTLAVLLRLDDDLHSDLARPAGRRCVRSASGLCSAVVGNHRRRLREGPHSQETPFNMVLEASA
jgi:hypothetical protein